MRTSILLLLLIFPIATDARAQAQDGAVPDIASMLTNPDEASGRRPPNAAPGSSDKSVGPTEGKSVGPTRGGRVAGAKRAPGEFAPEPTAGSQGRQGAHAPRSPKPAPRSPKSIDPPVRRAQGGADIGTRGEGGASGECEWDAADAGGMSPASSAFAPKPKVTYATVAEKPTVEEGGEIGKGYGEWWTDDPFLAGDVQTGTEKIKQKTGKK